MVMSMTVLSGWVKWVVSTAGGVKFLTGGVDSKTLGSTRTIFLAYSIYLLLTARPMRFPTAPPTLGRTAARMGPKMAGRMPPFCKTLFLDARRCPRLARKRRSFLWRLNFLIWPGVMDTLPFRMFMLHSQRHRTRSDLALFMMALHALGLELARTLRWGANFFTLLTMVSSLQGGDAAVD